VGDSEIQDAGRQMLSPQEACLAEVHQAQEQVDGRHPIEAQAGEPGETDMPVDVGRRCEPGPRGVRSVKALYLGHRLKSRALSHSAIDPASEE
jgi:hypothetical protein